MVSLEAVSGSLKIFQRILREYKPIGCRDDILNSFFWQLQNQPTGPQGPEAWILSVARKQQQIYFCKLSHLLIHLNQYLYVRKTVKTNLIISRSKKFQLLAITSWFSYLIPGHCSERGKINIHLVEFVCFSVHPPIVFPVHLDFYRKTVFVFFWKLTESTTCYML